MTTFHDWGLFTTPPFMGAVEITIHWVILLILTKVTLCELQHKFMNVPLGQSNFKTTIKYKSNSRFKLFYKSFIEHIIRELLIKAIINER